MCYKAIDPEELKQMSKSAMDAKCAKQKSDVRAILESNELTMTQNVRDRTKILYELVQVTPKMEYVRAESRK